MRATELTLRSTLSVLTSLGRGVACLCPNSPQPRERPKSLRNASAPCLYLQDHKKKSRDSRVPRSAKGQEGSRKE